MVRQEVLTGPLFVFFRLFEHPRLTPPTAIVVAMSLGSVGNPSGFLALAVNVAATSVGNREYEIPG